MRETKPKYTVPEHLDADALFVEDLMRQRYRRWKDRPYGGLEKRLSRWAFVVEEIIIARVSEYYLDSEYENDLAGRRILAEMLQAAEQHELIDLLKWAIPLVDEIDETFRQHSFVDVDQFVVAGNRWTADYWFLRRIPKHQGLIDSYQNLGPRNVATLHQRPNFKLKNTDRQ